VPVLLDKIIKDKRADVRVGIISIPGLSESSFINTYQQSIGLKALAKCKEIPKTIGRVNVEAFINLKPLEKLNALKNYLSLFRPHSKSQVFSKPISDEEFKSILFCGCIEHNNLVSEINKKYDEIKE
jgi:hypothetical protein